MDECLKIKLGITYTKHLTLSEFKGHHRALHYCFLLSGCQWNVKQTEQWSMIPVCTLIKHILIINTWLRYEQNNFINSRCRSYKYVCVLLIMSRIHTLWLLYIWFFSFFLYFFFLFSSLLSFLYHSYSKNTITHHVHTFNF